MLYVSWCMGAVKFAGDQILDVQPVPSHYTDLVSEFQ
jgi:hypothetical protein